MVRAYPRLPCPLAKTLGPFNLDGGGLGADVDPRDCMPRLVIGDLFLALPHRTSIGRACSLYEDFGKNFSGSRLGGGTFTCGFAGNRNTAASLSPQGRRYPESFPLAFRHKHFDQALAEAVIRLRHRLPQHDA